MRKITYLALAAATVLTVASCGSHEEKKEPAKTEKACFYSYNAGSTVMEWTAFKFTEKKGVTGTFTTINVKDGGAKEDPEAVIESLSFSIPVSSVETQNPERNAKIIEHFFKTISTETIEGRVKDLKDGGKAVIEITMNKITKDVEGNWTLEDGDFAFHATIDVANWNGLPGIAALNKICYDLHKGPDGVSKLWSEVDLSFTTVLSSDCD